MICEHRILCCCDLHGDDVVAAIVDVSSDGEIMIRCALCVRDEILKTLEAIDLSVSDDTQGSPDLLEIDADVQETLLADEYGLPYLPHWRT